MDLAKRVITSILDRGSSSIDQNVHSSSRSCASTWCLLAPLSRSSINTGGNSGPTQDYSFVLAYLHPCLAGTGGACARWRLALAHQGRLSGTPPRARPSQSLPRALDAATQQEARERQLRRLSEQITAGRQEVRELKEVMRVGGSPPRVQGGARVRENVIELQAQGALRR